MSQLINVPLSEAQKMAAAPLELARLQAAELIQAGDVAGANRAIAEGIAQSASFQAQIQVSPQQAALGAVQPPAPAAITAPVAPELPRFVSSPRTMGEEMMARAWRSNQERRTAEDAGAAMTDLSRPMGLRPSRR